MWTLLALFGRRGGWPPTSGSLGSLVGGRWGAGGQAHGLCLPPKAPGRQVLTRQSLCAEAFLGLPGRASPREKEAAGWASHQELSPSQPTWLWPPEPPAPESQPLEGLLCGLGTKGWTQGRLPPGVAAGRKASQGTLGRLPA